MSQILTQAFHHDPVYRWFFPNELTRARKCRRLFMLFLNDLIPQGSVFTTAKREGMALWSAPEQVESGWLKRVKQGAQILPILGPGILRGLRWWLTVESQHPCYSHWYLFLLGVAPEHQGRGIGSALLQPMLKRCDMQRLPIYLDTGNQENVPFYQHRGFTLASTVDLPDGPKIFRMIREPVVR